MFNAGKEIEASSLQWHSFFLHINKGPWRNVWPKARDRVTPPPPSCSPIWDFNIPTWWLSLKKTCCLFFSDCKDGDIMFLNMFTHYEPWSSIVVWGFSSSRYSRYSNVPLCEEYCTRSSSRYLNILWPRKNHNIYVHTIYGMSHIQYVLSGSIVGLMWDLETSWNFNIWFYSNDKWGWLCVIQYPVCILQHSDPKHPVLAHYFCVTLCSDTVLLYYKASCIMVHSSGSGITVLVRSCIMVPFTGTIGTGTY